MRRNAKGILAGLMVAGAVALSPLSADAQQFVYSDVVPTPTECDAANPGGAFAAWVQFLPSKIVQLELSSTLPGASGACFFTHLTQYANGDTKVLPAGTFQLDVTDFTSTGTFFPVVEYSVNGGASVAVKLTPTAVRLGHNGRKATVFYNMATSGVPAGARLINLYLLTYFDNGGPFFGYFQNFVLNGTRVLNKNFTTYPCLGDIAVQVKNFAP